MRGSVGIVSERIGKIGQYDRSDKNVVAFSLAEFGSIALTGWIASFVFFAMLARIAVA